MFGGFVLSQLLVLVNSTFPLCLCGDPFYLVLEKDEIMLVEFKLFTFEVFKVYFEFL